MENEMPSLFSWSVSSQDLSRVFVQKCNLHNVFQNHQTTDYLPNHKICMGASEAPPNFTTTCFCGHGPSHPSGRNTVEKRRCLWPSASFSWTWSSFLSPEEIRAALPVRPRFVGPAHIYTHTHTPAGRWDKSPGLLANHGTWGKWCGHIGRNRWSLSQLCYP